MPDNAPSSEQRCTADTLLRDFKVCGVLVRRTAVGRVIFATARTQIDRVNRAVVFENLQISKIDFPTLPDRGVSYGPELTREFASKVRTMALDKLEASLAANGIKPAPVEVNNAPPRVIISNAP